MTEPVTTTERWTCLGVRESAGKLCPAWLDSDGKTVRVFGARSRVKGFAGNDYDVQIIRDGDTVSVSGRPEYVGQHPDEERRREWATTSRTIETRFEAERAAKRQGDALAQACEPLKALMAQERTARGRRALLANILTELGVS